MTWVGKVFQEASLRLDCGRVVTSESQKARQSVWHRPWHLNSRPGVPMLPPQPGQMQLRMLESMSSAVWVVGEFVYGMVTSYFC